MSASIHHLVVESTAYACGVEITDVLTISRRAMPTLARHMAWHLLKHRFGWPYTHIAHTFKVSPEAVRMGIATMEDRIVTDPTVRAMVSALHGADWSLRRGDG